MADRNPFSELGRATSVATRIVRARPLVLLGAIATSLLLPSCACLVGLGLIPLVGGSTLLTARNVVAPLPTSPPRRLVVLTYCLLPLATALAWGLFHGLDPVLGGVAHVLAAGVVGALFALVAGVPYYGLGGDPLAVALERSLGDAVSVGLRRRLVAGAVIAGITALPGVLVVGARHDLALVATLSALVGGGVGLVWLFALGTPDGAPAAHEETARGALARIAQLGVPVLTVLALALVWAAARPSLVHSVPSRDEISRASRIVDGAMELPGEAGLRVVRTATGVRIETADGGGAGDVDLGAWNPVEEPWVGVADEADKEGYLVVATGMPPTHWLLGPELSGTLARRAVRFDRRGVRTDDGILDRVAFRFGTLGLGLLGLALLLCVPFALVLARGIGSATLLDRPSADASWTAWQGSLDLDDDAKLSVGKGKLAIDGAARVVRDGSEGVVTLVAGAGVLGDAPLVTGARVAVVAPKRLLAELGPRSGAIPWPHGAWLVTGTLGAAKRRIADQTLRAAARFGVPAAFAALGAAIASFFG